MTRETYKSVYEAWVSDYVFYSWKHSILEVNFTISITFFMGARSQIDYHCPEQKSIISSNSNCSCAVYKGF